MLSPLIKTSLCLIGVLIFSLPALAQKRIDTVYLDDNKQEVAANLKAQATSFEIRHYSRKGLLQGMLSRFDMNGHLLEATEYTRKGEKSGSYTSFDRVSNRAVYGTYQDGKKTGTWTTVQNEQLLVVEKYANDELLDRREVAHKGLKVVVKERPSFKGGPGGWTNFLRANLKYPVIARRMNIQGVVALKFLVLEDGTVTAVTIKSSPGSVLSTEALRIMRRSPNWIPATKNGKPIIAPMELQIAFKLR